MHWKCHPNFKNELKHCSHGKNYSFDAESPSLPDESTENNRTWTIQSVSKIFSFQEEFHRNSDVWINTLSSQGSKLRQFFDVWKET